MSTFTVTSYTWAAFAPVAIAVFVFVLCLILWQADFIFASGLLAWGVVVAVLLLWGFGVFPIRGEYDQSSSTMHLEIRIVRPNESDPPPEFLPALP
jgi:peptidoglycan biosynthesis protein MviN/MurJ (putative lipid II flippase)